MMRVPYGSSWRYSKVIPLLTDPARTAPIPLMRSTSARRTCPATDTPTGRPARHSTPWRSAGLAAWIVEKLRAWSDCDGDVERRFTTDEMLTNVTLYWLTGTIARRCARNQASAAIPPAEHARRVEVASGFSLFRGDVVRPPRVWLERTTSVVRVTEPARGGHFALFEEPELYAEELREGFRPYRAAATSPQSSDG